MQRGGVKALIIILVILVLVAGGVLAYKIIQDKNNKEVASEEENVLVAELEEENYQEFEYDPKEDGTSLALIKGTVKKMKDLGYNVDGFLCYCDSTIFKGAGVSSSAASGV